MDNVAVGYERHVVLQDISLGLTRGSFVGLLGANGSGKSTLIKTILGIIPSLRGHMEVFPIDGRKPVFGYVPQRESLDSIFLLSSFEVVLMGVCGRVGPGRRIRSSEKEWAHQCLRETNADTISRKRFSQLSGGQKQRVLIARALATRPDFLLLDEPTAGIDTAAAQAIMELLRRLYQQRGLTILMVSHDLPTVRKHVQKVIWLHQGKVLQGSVDELLSRDKLDELLDLELN
jgi:ABC-type Mn2+/Zn2+ transport system ATPase subunit